MRLNLKGLLLIFTTLFYHEVSLSAQLRLSGGLGFGSTSSKNEITESEGPLAQIYSVESILHSKLIVGAEHKRSLNLSPVATSMSFTGIFTNWYITSVPTPYYKAEDMDSAKIVFRDIGYFAGGSVGLAQSNRLPDIKNKTSNAAGVYVGFHGGMEMYLTRTFGVRGQAVLANTVFGSGNITMFGLFGSLIWAL